MSFGFCMLILTILLCAGTFGLPPLMDGDIFLYGHTHVLRAEKKGAHTFLNPGSVSLPKEGNIPTYAILEDGVFTIKGFDGTVVKQLTL